jgi:hypothetical protein
MDTNSYQLKITGGAELPQQIDTTKGFTVKAELDCYKVSKTDNQDGTFDIAYYSRITSPIEVTQGETKIKGKDKKRWSQKMRALLYYHWKEDGAEGGQDDYYDIYMDKIYRNFETLKEFLKNK